MTSKPRLNGALRLLFRLPAILYRGPCGWLLGRRFLLLIHVGRRTGKLRRTVLEVIEYRQIMPEAIVISAFGPKSDWLLNMQTQAPIEVAIASQRFTAAYRFLGEEEAAAAILGYQRRHRLLAPLIRFALGKFAGWRYDGTLAHARRLVRQLPVIGFRPASVVPASLSP
jgi:deazaflavin-dependent oxidoreductase (nitroreductase family)